MANPNTNGQLITTTLENLAPAITDNISNRNALFSRMKEKGNFKKLSGGSKIREKVSYASNTNVQFQDAWDTLATTPQDTLTYADFEEKLLTGTVALSYVDLVQNSGKEQLIDLLEAQTNVLMATLKNQVGTTIYSDGSTANQFGGLQLLVADDPTTGTVGGISRSSYSFWRNKLWDFSVESITAGSTTIQNAMNVLYRRCQAQADKTPDLIMAGDTYFGYYESSMQNILRVNTSKMADAGFDALKYKTADVVYDPNCSSTRMYFLNTDHIFFKYWGDALFKIHSERVPVNQLSTVYPVSCLGNLSIDNARVHGVMIA